jgi:ribonuclease BN (tRNA processing enzyme)
MAAVSIRFLGSGDAFCSAGSNQSSYLVESGEGAFLMDCGATALASLKKSGIRTESVDAVLVSHMHGDHFAGIPFLLLEYIYVEPRTRPLVIAGPPGIKDRVAALFRAMYRDAATEPLPFPLGFVELTPGEERQIGPARVEPFQVPHSRSDISLALDVSVGGRRILYSGDTGWTEDLVRHSQGTDLFVCECTFFETRIPTHLDYPEIARNRNRFGTDRLVLSHLGAEVLARRADINIELAQDNLLVRL